MKQHLSVLRSGPGMTTTRSLFLVILIGLLPAVAAAAPEPALVPEEVVKKARGTVLSVKQDFEETGTFWNYCGVLIDDKGLAVVPLKAMCYRLPPTFRDSKGGVIPFRKVLAIDSKRSLAVVRLEVGKRKGLKLAPKAAEPREPIALLWDDISRKTQGVLDGPVLARRQIHKRGPESSFYLSLGFYLGGDNPSARTGSPVINSHGELVGIYTLTHRESVDVPKQTHAVTSEDISELLKMAEANPQGLPLPLVEDNPFDQVFWEYSLSPETVGRTTSGLPHLRPGQDAKGLKDEKVAQFTALASKYPKSRWAKMQLWSAIGEESISRLAKIYAGFDKNDRTTGTRMMEVIQDQIRQIEATGKIHGVAQADIEAKKSGLERQSLVLTGDFRKLLEHDQKALLLWGDAPPGELLADIAFAQAETGDMKSAAETWKRASALATDSLHYQRLYEFFLSKHSDASEAKRVSELLWDLDEIYAPRKPRRVP